MSRASPGPLAGRTVVVTRPQAQAAALLARIDAAGGRAVAFPTIAIEEAADLGPLIALLDRLETFDLAIFISPTAVDRALNLIRARRALPPGLVMAAIGKGSARELARFGVHDVVVPQGRFDSEGLLAQAPFADVAGRRIVIFRGEGGREHLGDTLIARGARVEYGECYRRVKPDADAQVLLRLWARAELDAIVVTSSEGLRNLYEMVGRLGQQWLRRTPVFVPHPRIAEAARELGMVDLTVTDPGDEAVVTAIEQRFAVRAP